MEETQACRVCLATDVRLYNVHKYGLSENLRSITGFLIQQADGLPQGVCSYCAVSLQKCVAFRTRYHASQCVLNSILERGLILSHHIGTIDRQAKNLTNPLTIHTDHHIIDIQHTENVIKEEVPFKDEENSIDNFELKLDNGVFKAEDDYPFLDSPGNSADDEPLAFRVKREKKVKKSVKKKKKVTLDVKDIQRQTEDANIELVLLSKQEQIDEIQARKESTNYASALFKCDKCFKGFLQETTFKNHMAMHDPSIGPFKCDICSVYCASERRVRAHKKVAHERRYICRLCKNVATTSHYAREHQRWHNGVTYDCKKCDMSFRKSTSYLTHLRLQHPSEYVCDICGASFIGKNGLNTHKLKTHKHDQASLESTSYLTHLRLQHPSEYVCDICGASFIGKNGLNTHKLKTHKHDQSTSYLTHLRLQHPSEYVCDICGASFIGKNGLNTHKLKTHKHDQEPDRDLFCEDCELKFRSNEALQRHRETSSHHTKTDQFFKSCLACGSSFDSERALWEHNKTHKTQIEKVKCKEVSCNL
ncbi:hypothetical protein JYU34_008307 [Plutella xylostella]|uniref:Uncharacterized protein n=1 Tax=Plutella xylostella TaxID=51655 RepID=A0ABQ7QP78_PLUXY|nr:hypothetical protein JYU34_008307 [Plutella xylostella]